MARSTWPIDPKSAVVPTGIDWRAASPLAFTASKLVWKRVSQPDALALMEDPRYKPIFRTLPADIQEIIVASATAEETPKEQTDENDQRDAILREVDEAIKEAGDTENVTAKLQGIKLKAELWQLLAKKPQEERNIVINVVTGVER